MNHTQISNATTPRQAPRRVAKSVQINQENLVRCLRSAITQVDTLDHRPQRPMVSGTGFEPLYRDFEQRCDRLTCFLACLSGSLSFHVPEAGAQILAFLEKTNMAVAVDGAAA